MADFLEMADALHELGFTEQDMANAELLAHDLRRAGWNETSAELTLHRMRKRAAALDEARRILSGVSPYQALVRELAKQDPPRWRIIGLLFAAICFAHVRKWWQ